MWLSLLFGALLMSYVDGATLPFLTTWSTSAPNETVTLPLSLLASPLNITWDDSGPIEVFDANTTAPINHTYDAAGLHNVSILGDLYWRSFGAQTDSNKLVDIRSWGDGFLMNNLSLYAFANCSNLSVSASPNTQPVFLPGATLRGMFMRTKFNSPLNWNLTNVNSVVHMFQEALRFNQSINFTNTAEVTNTSMMFLFAADSNQLVTFDTSNVVDMTGMFASAINFNQPVNFNTTSVQSMYAMFVGALLFNQPVNFNTSNVNTMVGMFANATVFNQPVNFDTRKVTTMAAMFLNALAFNQSIDFQADSLTTASQMFEGASNLSQPVKLSNSNLLNIASRMFANVNECFNSVNISSTTNVVNMDEMFVGAKSFHQNLGDWDTSSVVSCSSFCPYCGLPSFTSCSNYCNGSQSILTPENVPVCALPHNQPTCPSPPSSSMPSPSPASLAPSPPALCELVVVSTNLQVQCLTKNSTMTEPPATTTEKTVLTILSPLFNITREDGDNSTIFVFTLPTDSKLLGRAMAAQPSCSGSTVSCEWLDPQAVP